MARHWSSFVAQWVYRWFIARQNVAGLLSWSTTLVESFCLCIISIKKSLQFTKKRFFSRKEMTGLCEKHSEPEHRMSVAKVIHVAVLVFTLWEVIQISYSCNKISVWSQQRNLVDTLQCKCVCHTPISTYHILCSQLLRFTNNNDRN